MTKDQKPKRSYTVTERVLAACRLNIKKAQKAALEQRFCVTRGTSRELDARHAKLELAQKVKREDRTYKYCSCFRHGLLVADLERSLFMAGESRAEYQAHLARFEALPAVFALDAGSGQVKLARACAFASWRRLRAFRLHSEWALRMMVHHLRKVIRERQAASGEEKASLGDREKALRELVLSSAAQSGSVIPSPASFQRGEGSRSAEAMPDSSLAGSGLPAAPRNDGLNECFHSPAGQPLSLTPEQFLELGRGLRWAAESWPGVWQGSRPPESCFGTSFRSFFGKWWHTPS